MVKFKDFSRPLSIFQVLFKAIFIFKDFLRLSCIFKYFSQACVNPEFYAHVLNGFDNSVDPDQLALSLTKPSDQEPCCFQLKLKKQAYNCKTAGLQHKSSGGV